ncbi:MAG TPA: AmmeMemoRadiSam system protein B [Candidatus Sulfotelmatobacter sp.]|jgi:AmmeMemoRadiSam system protein B/AmmeMemoRadiSam system protein A|nr:AmmeMemoRadiSam system protein B [Candidatus Sulfotelmatobacter sp.]
MSHLRKPAVAGAFYPAQPQQLAADVHAFLAAVPRTGEKPAPKAVIAPHAGYVYSGPIAASVYARLLPTRGRITRVVLMGPSHRVAFKGIAGCTADAYETPFGPLPIDKDAYRRALGFPDTGILDAAHEQEHSLEVHLPFLQAVLGPFSLVPLVVGDAPPELVAQVLEAVWGGPETLIVISSDLSHYLDYETARSLDHAACQAIEHLDGGALRDDQACGRIPVKGLLSIAKRRGMTVETVDLRNSGDTAGPKDRVVGYGAWAFCEPARDAKIAPEESERIRAQASLLLELARSAIESRLSSGQPAAMPDPLPDLLRQPGAAFVTLKLDGQLRGCIGSPQAWRSLGEDIVDNAQKAAFHDPRFPALSTEEWPDLELSVSVLTPPVPMDFRDETDLLAQLRPHVDGLIIEDDGRRSLFLPSVWEVLPTPKEFLSHLKRKAGMAEEHWSPSFKASRFLAVELKNS